MYVDNAAMQLVRAPKQFDVIVTGNLLAISYLTKQQCLLVQLVLPSASLDEVVKVCMNLVMVQHLISRGKM